MAHNNLQNVPLTEAQQKLPSGAIMPSGEANFYDFQQHDSPINKTFPSPIDFAEESGVLPTYPNNSGLTDIHGHPMDSADGGITDSILAPIGLDTPFSSGQVNSGIKDFTIFNPYIDYFANPNPPRSLDPDYAVYITYAMVYEKTSPWEPY